MKHLFLIFFGIGMLQAQITSVTFQVTDIDGQTWNNGTWTASLYSPTGVPCCNYVILGSTTVVPNQIQSGSLDASGNGSLIVTPNTSIAPIGTQWQFSFCPAATSPCIQQSYTISGASQVLTTGLPAIRINARSPSPRLAAYTNTEVVGGLPGTQYWNLTDASIHVCSLLSGGNCLWSVIGTAGGVVPVGVGVWSVLASNGVSNPPVYQTKPVLDVRDISGVDCTGTNDSAVALNAFTGNVPTSNDNISQRTLSFGNCLQIKLASTWLIKNQAGFIIDCITRSGGASKGCNLSWAGAANGVMIDMEYVDGFQVQGLNIQGNATAGVGIQIDKNGATAPITLLMGD